MASSTRTRAADRGAQARSRHADQDHGDQQVGGQAGHLAAEVVEPGRRPVVCRAEPHVAAHAERAEDQRRRADQGGAAPVSRARPRSGPGESKQAPPRPCRRAGR